MPPSNVRPFYGAAAYTVYCTALSRDNPVTVYCTSLSLVTALAVLFTLVQPIQSYIDGRLYPCTALCRAATYGPLLGCSPGRLLLALY